MSTDSPTDTKTEQPYVPGRDVDDVTRRRSALAIRAAPVSYTHLTLPTIYPV